MTQNSLSHLPGRTGYTLCGKPISKNIVIAYSGLEPTCRACQRAARKRPGRGVNLHLRGVDPEIAAIIKQYQVTRNCFTISEAVQRIVKEWDEFQEYFDEQGDTVEIVPD